MSTYFFSYGDNKYKNSKERIKNEANNFGFDYVNVYGREDISEEFLNKTRPYIDMSRGGGYWLWKAFFLKKTFDAMQENDICVYADAGCHVNSHGKKRFEFYKELLELNESGVLSFAIQPESEYTNEMVFEHFDINENSPIRNSRQYLATVLYFRKCDNTIKIVNEYYELSMNNPDLFSDIHNDYKITKEFKDHRHDQSILSMLRKKYASVVIPDETYALNHSNLVHVPILATRIRE